MTPTPTPAQLAELELHARARAAVLRQGRRLAAEHPGEFALVAGDAIVAVVASAAEAQRVAAQVRAGEPLRLMPVPTPAELDRIERALTARGVALEDVTADLYLAAVAHARRELIQRN